MKIDWEKYMVFMSDKKWNDGRKYKKFQGISKCWKWFRIQIHQKIVDMKVEKGHWENKC